MTQSSHSNITDATKWKTKVWSFYHTIPCVCQFVGASPCFCSPAVEPLASVCVCAAASSPSAALPAAGRSPAAAERTKEATELNHIDQTPSKSQICIPLLWPCWCLERFGSADLSRDAIEMISVFWSLLLVVSLLQQLKEPSIKTLNHLLCNKLFNHQVFLIKIYLQIVF